MSVIVAIGGYKTVGKDTVGELLSELYGFQRLAFADPLKAVALAADPIIALSGTNFSEDKFEPWRLSEMVDTFGWEDVKSNFPESRRFLQKLGQEGCRNVLGSDIWINAALAELDKFNGLDIVFTDMRYKNEAEVLKRRGAVILRLNRPGCEAGEHASEREIDEVKPDYVINNDGSLDDLKTKVDEFMTWCERKGMVILFEDLGYFERRDVPQGQEVAELSIELA